MEIPSDQVVWGFFLPNLGVAARACPVVDLLRPQRHLDGIGRADQRERFFPALQRQRVRDKSGKFHLPVPDEVEGDYNLDDLEMSGEVGS